MSPHNERIPMKKIASIRPHTQEKRCSCCELLEEQVSQLLRVTSLIQLCDGCLGICMQILAEEGIRTSDTVKIVAITSKQKSQYACSVCGKTMDKVVRLIAMLKGIYICNTCVGSCVSRLPSPLVGDPIAPQEGAVVDDQNTSP